VCDRWEAATAPAEEAGVRVVKLRTGLVLGQGAMLTTVLGLVFRAGLGGRIFERTPSGDEHDWGEVTVWNPPTQLGYLWHLRRDRADATEVEITFRPRGPQTLVEIAHRGWERLGAGGPDWRERNRGGWSTLLPHYVRAVDPTAAATITWHEEEADG